jgi:nitroreductase
MDFEEVVRKRQSIRRFEEKEIPEEKIREILELANLSPSAGNLQARKVFLIKDKETKEKIAPSQDFIAEAGIVLIICADRNESAKYGERGRELYSIQDATIFASYLQLAATSLGLASCWVGTFDEEEIKRILNLPEGLKPIAILPIGYAAEKPARTPRKKLEDICS